MKRIIKKYITIMIYSSVSEIEIISELYIIIVLYNIKLVLGGWTMLCILLLWYTYYEIWKSILLAYNSIVIYLKPMSTFFK